VVQKRNTALKSLYRYGRIGAHIYIELEKDGAKAAMNLPLVVVVQWYQVNPEVAG